MTKKISLLLFLSILILSFGLGTLTFFNSLDNQKISKIEAIQKELRLELDLRRIRLEYLLEATEIDLRLVALSKSLQEPLENYYALKERKSPILPSENWEDKVFVGYEELGNSILGFGYHDFFVVDRDGEVIYSVKKESDYRTNLVTGEFSNTGLGAVFRRVQEKGAEAVTSTLERYSASDSVVSLFLAVPVVKLNQDKEYLGAVIIQIIWPQLVETLGPKRELKMTHFFLQSQGYSFHVDDLITQNADTVDVYFDGIATNTSGEDEITLRAAASINSNIELSYVYPVSLGITVWFTTMFVGLMMKRLLYFRKKNGPSTSDVFLVQGTWNSIIDDPEKIGNEFYNNLIESDVRFSSIFQNVDHMEVLPGKLVSMMSMIVNNADQMEVLKNEISKLATFHVRLGVRPEDVPKFMDCMYMTVEEQYDGELSPPLKKAWYSVLNEVSRIFIHILSKEIKRETIDDLK